MYALSKLLPLFVLPLGVTSLLMLVGILARRWSFVMLGAVLLFTASLPVTADSLTLWAERGQVRLEPSSMPQAEAIVVLSGGRPTAPGPTGASEWNDGDRFFGGIELFEAQRAPYLVFTGALDPMEALGITEGDVLAGHARTMGVPGDAILVTGEVLNTADEAREVAALLRDAVGVESPATILLVTSVLHMPRAATVFARAGLRVIAYPVDFERGPQHPLAVMAVIPTAEALERTSYVLRELLGRFLYRVPWDAPAAIIDPD